MLDMTNEALSEPTYSVNRDDRSSSNDEVKKATIPKDKFPLNGFLNKFIYVSGSQQKLFRFKFDNLSSSAELAGQLWLVSFKNHLMSKSCSSTT